MGGGTVTPWRVVSQPVNPSPSSVNQPSLGDIIRERRLTIGLTKSEAARRAGVSRGTWHDVESGRRSNMLADTLNLFDQALGLPRGTLRNAGRPGEPINMELEHGGGHVIEQLKHVADDDALRLQLVQYVMTMPTSDLRRLAVFIGTGSAAGQEWLRAELHQIMRDDPPVFKKEHPANDTDHPQPSTHRRSHIHQVATGT